MVLRARVRVPTAVPLAVLLGLVLGGCGASGGSVPSGAGTVADGPRAGTVVDRPLPADVLALPFTDADGRRVTLAGLAGRTVVVTDFLTTCQEVCPMTTVDVVKAADAVAEQPGGSQVTFLEVTVDPGRDDPQRLAAYRDLYGTTHPNWELLTGAPAAVDRLWTALGVYHERKPDAAPYPKDWLTGRPLTYDVAHQDVVFLLDGRGHERWLLQGTPSTEGAQPPATLEAFLNDEGRRNLASPGADGPTWTTGDLVSAVSWWQHAAPRGVVSPASSTSPAR